MFGLSGFKEVDPAYVAEIAAKGAHLIDVRTEAEVAQGVIDGAIHIPLHLLPLRATDIPQDKPLPRPKTLYFPPQHSNFGCNGGTSGLRYRSVFYYIPI